ncbi:MAG: zinc ribbon domain-containing protein [Pirellulales bacterium]
MPTYDYQCDACDHKFEAFQSISEEPLTKCPNWQKKKLRRRLSWGCDHVQRLRVLHHRLP